MGNFEKLSVLVIVVIIVMILVVALYTWTDNPDGTTPAVTKVSERGAYIPGPDDLPKSGDDKVGDRIKDWSHGEDIPLPPEPPVVRPVDVPSPLPPSPEPPTPDKIDPVPPASEEIWMYTVQPGDTLTQISERELGTWRRYKEILKLNPGVKAETIREGDVLKMPPRHASSSLKVTPGEHAQKGAGGKMVIHLPSRGRIALGETYVIQEGDRLSRISKRAYGTIDRWPELWARNLSVIDDPDEPRVGAKIFIPK